MPQQSELLLFTLTHYILVLFNNVLTKTKASLSGRSGGLHLGNVMMHMHVSEVRLWRDLDDMVVLL